jgi:hypothetical protein
VSLILGIFFFISAISKGIGVDEDSSLEKIDGYSECEGFRDLSS